MVSSLLPVQYLIAELALWLSCQQKDAIDYLTDDNRMLEVKFGEE